MESSAAEQLTERIQTRLAQFEAAGGSIRTTTQTEGAPKWLSLAHDRFRLTYAWNADGGGRGYWQEIMQDALAMAGDKKYHVSVAFGPKGEMSAVASYRKWHYESRYMNRNYPELYLAYLGSTGRVPGAGTAVMLEVAKLALANKRPAFAHVSRAGSFYTELGWELIKVDPNGDHWRWPLEACQVVVEAAALIEKAQEAPSL
jgi:hypothetical protein